MGVAGGARRGMVGMLVGEHGDMMDGEDEGRRGHYLPWRTRCSAEE
jgi:hypothetical protein